MNEYDWLPRWNHIDNTPIYPTERKTPLINTESRPIYNLLDQFPVSSLAEHLGSRVRRLELENAQLKHQLNEAEKKSVEGRVQRHLARYRKKFQDAYDNNDFVAASSADQRVRALQALLEP